MARAKRHTRPHGRRYALRLLTHAAVAIALLAVVVVGARFTIAAPADGFNASLKVSAFSLPGLAATVPDAHAGSPLTPPAVAVTVVPASEQPTLVTSSAPTPEAVRQVSQAVVEGTAVPASSAVVRASRTQEPVLKYYQYQVQPGDTVNLIAARSGIDPKYIIWNNIDIISNEHLLTVGDILQIPAVEGILHPVKIGDTLTGIANQYGSKVADIVAFPGNGLANPGDLKEGSIILVPGGRIPDRANPNGRPTPPAQVAQPQPTAAAAAAAQPRPSGATGWVWPVVNNVTSYFGASHPLGIDIEAPYVPVVASRSGQVVFVGGDPCCSYGLYIIIRHDGEYETRYAHLSQFSVQLGQWVDAGQQIGISGSTGRSTGAHLHFEVIYNGYVSNPLAVLP